MNCLVLIVGLWCFVGLSACGVVDVYLTCRLL